MTTDSRVADLEERFRVYSQQVAHVLHEIINLRENRPFGWRSDMTEMREEE